MGDQRHAPIALPPGKTRYPLYSRLDEPQGRSKRARKISPPPGFDPGTAKPVASRYTGYVMPAHLFQISGVNKTNIGQKLLNTLLTYYDSNYQAEVSV